MKLKDDYVALGVDRTAGQDEIKRADRKLARKHHPDLNKAPQAEDRFKEVAEAHEALIDPGRHAAYDELQRRHDHGEAWAPAQDGGGGARGAPGARADVDMSDFFASLFGRPAGPSRAADGARRGWQAAGDDQHAKVAIDLDEAYRGAKRIISLQMPGLSAGRSAAQVRQLEVDIPRKLRLRGKGIHGKTPGDLYAVLGIAVPTPQSAAQKRAYEGLAAAFVDVDPRSGPAP